MKAKVLIGNYPQESGYSVTRVYLEKDFAQAELDLKMISEIDSLGKDWRLENTELFGNPFSLLDSLKGAKALLNSVGVLHDTKIGKEEYDSLLYAIKLLEDK